eukprot:Hpha_TRINITY_DN16616_c0_g2::TRINITY_DN16616_c0_g2_i2::g.178171::m.178171
MRVGEGVSPEGLSAVQTACNKGRHWRGALGTLSFARLHKVGIDATIVSGAMKGCSSHPDTTRAVHSLWDELGRSRVQPNTVVATVGVRSCSMNSLWQGSLGLVGKLRGCRVVPDPPLINVLSKSLLKEETALEAEVTQQVFEGLRPFLAGCPVGRYVNSWTASQPNLVGLRRTAKDAISDEHLLT